MNPLLAQILSALLYGFAGGYILFVFLNRFVFLTPDFKGKTLVTFLSFSLITILGITLGFLLPRPPWIYIPTLIIIIFLAGEIRRLFIRRACAGTRPIDTTPHAFNLAAPITTTDLVIHRYRIEHPKWHGKPFRIAHLTDLHANPALPLEYFLDVFKTAEELEPDIAVITGDFICRSDKLSILADILRPIAKTGTYAVLGNHDHWTDPDGIRKTITDCDVRLLENETTYPVLDGTEIAVTGYDFPWGTDDNTVPTPKGDMLHLVLSHTPDNIYHLSKSTADIVFSGHYHAGQIRVPHFGPLVMPSLYGRRFDHGHFVINGTDLFVPSGIGAANPPLRIFCHPDLFIIDVVPTD